jgi:hypothetical protein
LQSELTTRVEERFSYLFVFWVWVELNSKFKFRFTFSSGLLQLTMLEPFNFKFCFKLCLEAPWQSSVLLAEMINSFTWSVKDSMCRIGTSDSDLFRVRNLFGVFGFMVWVTWHCSLWVGQ